MVDTCMVVDSFHRVDHLNRVFSCMRLIFFNRIESCNMVDRYIWVKCCNGVDINNGRVESCKITDSCEGWVDFDNRVYGCNRVKELQHG